MRQVASTANGGEPYFVVRFLYGHQKLDRLIEGDSDVLIENGRIMMDRLRQELITLPELETAAHKQGFASLAEVERAVIEPGGTLSFLGKKPDAEVVRYRELVARLDQLASELVALRCALTKE